MATIRLSINPGDSQFQIIQAAGAATVTKFIELTVDTGNNITDGNSVSPRPIKRSEIYEALLKLSQQITMDQIAPGTANPFPD